MPKRKSFEGIWGLLAVGCLFLGLPAGSGAVEEKTIVQTVTDSSFEPYVLKSVKPVLVDFWATWCGPCQMYSPVVDQVAEEYKGRLRAARVEVDQNPALCRDYGVQYLPTSFLFMKGKPVHRWVGVVSQQDLEKGIDNLLQKDEKK